MSRKDLHMTSANMDGDFYDELYRAAENFNISSQNIFKDLIDMISQSTNCGLVTGMLTEYQDHSPERWETLYYSLSDDEIEFFTKVRQEYKVSISKLAFMAFVLFWKLLMFRYAERLIKFKVKFNFNSYDQYYCKFENYKEKYRKRLEIVKKE